ncbi:F-box only protein 28 isoform X1 [Halyomorpha halys]|uniref:F-box only protein 28 isoform X1 n=1 Tax=Halyomorpha halys TaxID=286706 RepID=UPI0006D4E394
MVSTRQSSNVGNAGDSSSNDSTGIKTRHSSHHTQSSALIPVTQASEYVSNKHFLDLPPEIFEKIFSYTGYKTVSQMRLVCRQMDRICGSVLNSTFQKLQTQMLHRFQHIKSKMPRRESARRNHPLACESDIIETLHMRLTLLQMSFGKHIERKHCCFFAGEILDEVYRILHYIKVTPKLARPYRVTDELFDLSTMAMEYFKEHIEPTLPEIAYFGTDFFDFTGSLQSSSNNKSWMLDSPPHSGKAEYEPAGPSEERTGDQPSPPPPQSNVVLRKRIRKIKQGMKKYNSQLILMKRELRSCKAKIADQQKQFHEYASRLDDYDKKSDETSRKFSTLLQELNKCKTELQYWRSKSPLNSLCVSCGKTTSGLTAEDLQFLASQGTSAIDEASTSELWPEPPPLPQLKRKSEDTPPPAVSKRPKKSRAILKVRNKRS